MDSSQFNNVEQVAKNRARLVNLGIEFAVFMPTETGLAKSILDATEPMRALFKATNFHDYATQLQGPAYKCLYSATFVSNERLLVTEMSAYRPNTKKGDPRMWFRYLKTFAQAKDAIAVVIYEGRPYLFNLSANLLPSSLGQRDSISRVLQRMSCQQQRVAEDLLQKLKTIAQQGIVSTTVAGDTAIGMAIEAALGIPPNSSKDPDYFGIELKSARSNKLKTRSTLFAQVPDWSKSVLKSSREILERYGYQRGNDFKLYCTVQAAKPNSQGLFFELAEDQQVLLEKHHIEGAVALWEAQILKQRLLEKHAETFWIEADSIRDTAGNEGFRLKSVIHTRSPNQSQLMPLLAEGVITMDHLIKRSSSTGRVSEKGPLFKILPNDLYLLFPEPVRYSLTN